MCLSGLDRRSLVWATVPGPAFLRMPSGHRHTSGGSAAHRLGESVDLDSPSLHARDNYDKGGAMARGSELWDRFDAAAVKGDYETVASLFAEDGVYVEPAGRHEGRNAMLAWMREYAEAVSDIRTEVSLVVADDDVIIAEYTWYATQSGRFPMPDGSVIPPSGKTMELPAVTVLRVKDGLIVEARDYFDQAPMLRQLGLMRGSTP